MTTETISPLYVSDDVIRARIGIGERRWRTIVRLLEPRGLPKRDPLFGGKRFWPAVERFLFRRAGLDGASESALIHGTQEDEDWE